MSVALAEGALAHVRGLHDLWAQITGRVRRPFEMRDRTLLNVLGIGLEQALSLRHGAPDYPAFEAWVLATAGPPDPFALARYHAWVEGVAPPPEVRAWLDAVDAAPPVLDAADLAHWDERGYVILRNAITPEEAKAAELALWAQVRGAPDDPGSWYGPRTNGIMIQHFQEPALEPARRSPRIHKAFAQLWGTADLWPTVDRMSFNPPERPDAAFPGPHLHWDISLAQPIPFSTGGILYLTDTAPDQGAFRLVPGFHRRVTTWLKEIGDVHPRTVDLGAEAVPIAAGAGDLIIWRESMPHGASPNRSTRPRMAQYVNLYSTAFTPQAEWL